MSVYIPNEILAQILVRLPVQSLIRFTSVCKIWYSLITSHSFIAKHLIHSKTNTEDLILKHYNFHEYEERYLLCRANEKFAHEFSELESPFSGPIRYKRTIGSCNGLVCMVDSNSKPCIILWNPSIRKSITLPMPSPRRSKFVLGFGAHPQTHEYMLVFIVYEKADVKKQKFPSKVELYTQGTGSWRSITSTGHPPHIPQFNCFQAFVNGAIHWIAFDSRLVDGFRNLIILFTMGSQAFSVMMMPAALVIHNPSQLSIMTYGESLAVFCREAPVGGYCCLWVMKKYGVAESWAKLYNISLPGGLKNIIVLRKNGEVLASTIDNQIRWYDCETKTLTNIGFAEKSDAFAAGTFMESLVLVKPGNGVF